MGKAMKASALVAAWLLLGGQAPAPVSAPQSGYGVYKGYAEPVYDGHRRFSQYVVVRDGTRLAVDVYRPTRNGVLVETPLPVVWTFTPYNRATRAADGTVRPSDASQLSLVSYGYVVAIADVRGKGASFGVRNGPADANETNDAHDITEWLARQPWSTGKVGMTGCSYFGATALQAVRSGAPSLKAAFVGTTMFDQYDTFAQGGITSPGLADENVSSDAVSEVDADTDRALLAEALTLRPGNTPTGKFFASTPYRDDVNPYTKSRWWEAGSFYPYVGQIRDDVGIYLYGGYHDVYADQTILAYRNVKANKKLAYGDWVHCETPGFRMDIERLRFFDHWLKGVPNGVMTEKPVHVYVSRAKDGTEWRALDAWPDAARTRLYLSTQETKPAGARGAQTPFFSGGLKAQPPGTGAAAVILDDIPPVQPVMIYGTMRAGVDPISATFTLPPQPAWREVIGSPVVRLWISAPASDADVFVYLEHVNRQGGAQVIARGALRASHRQTGEAPYDTGGLPWQTHRRVDAQPLTPGEPVALDITLSPTAYTFRPGDLVRLAVTTRNPRTGVSGAPITLLSDASHPSWIELPQTDTRDAALNGDESDGGAFERPSYLAGGE